jgi:3-oxoacyl-[acyl-carrier-protein] synthase II
VSFAAGSESVVVTGVGAVTALGLDVEETWSRLLSGADGTGPLSRFNGSGYRVRRACEVPTSAAGAGSAAESTLKCDIARRAAREAASSAGAGSAVEPARVGLVFATLASDLSPYEEQVRSGGGREIDRETAHHLMPSGIASDLASDLGCEGWVGTVLTACAAGNHAVAIGRKWILAGRADVMFVGGSDVITQTQYTHFHNVRSLSPNFCQPFDRDRRGLVIGEGAAFLVLESEAYARRRGAPILARVLGAGATCDAYHMTAPEPSGRGPEQAILAALADARLGADDIDYVCAHGTGTPLNDRVEAQTLRRLFGGRLPASSIKSMIGHCMGAASAIGAVASVLALRDQMAPPTIHFAEPDPDCPIDCVPNTARALRLRTVLNNALAFGGNNCALVLGEFDG